MFSARLQQRLAQINRGRRAARPATLAPRRDQEAAPARDILTTAGINGGTEIETPHGRLWLVERDVTGGARAASTHDRATAPEPHAELAALAACLPAGAVFLDLETCGLGSSTIFLAGVIYHVGGGYRLSQLLARHYGEEAALLWRLAQLVEDKQVLVTFNGKSFDWPCVLDRTVCHRLPPPGQDMTHCDLLHHARRRYKHELPNCKLQTLEWYLCGRRRVDDIPGSEIPAAYHEFVRTGAEDEMQSILHHNALDLLTLLELAERLLEQ